ncbi:hypothetical protein HPB48_022049 [Haemaphysalis longicornis]|uniref:Glycosyltransferase family 92 protein n=1 Tax=Haemaphysalis longicornis TaxID=44386 RepID=A0A9J6G9P6_HAELO|nr:hypothetical protein HPB48_022049 [Haemaphysalis longicornis]
MQAKLACHIDDGKTKFTVSFKMRVVPEHLSGEYVTAMISCRLYTNGNLRPMKVAIGPLENQSSLHWLIIYQPLNAQISLMSVCVGPIFGNYPHVSHVAEFFTYYTTMGVETFHVYLENASQAVTFLLLHLQTRANVSIKFHWWNIENEGRHFMIHGQLAAIQDCIYRSKRSSKYVVNVDLDEFIVPTAGRTLSHAVVDLEKSVGERSLGSMLVPNWMFCFEYPANSSVFRGPPFFLTTALTTRERKPWFYKVRSKYIASTSAVVMGGVHFVWKHTPGRREVKVPETVLALNHYRTCCGLENYAVLNKLVLNHTDVVRDKTIQRHMWRAMTSLVFAAIKELTL